MSEIETADVDERENGSPIPSLRKWYLACVGTDEQLLWDDGCLSDQQQGMFSRVHPHDRERVGMFLTKAKAMRAADRFRSGCHTQMNARLQFFNGDDFVLTRLRVGMECKPSCPITTSRILVCGDALPIDHSLDFVQVTLEQADILPVAAWRYDLTTGRVRVTSTWAERLGYSLDELEPFTHADWISITHPQDVARFDGAENQMRLRQGELVQAVTRSRHRDGSWRHLLSFCRATRWNSAGVHSLITGFDLDFTDHARLEAELAMERDRLDAMLDATPLGQVLLGADDTVEYCNDAACAIMHRGREEVRGMRLDTLLSLVEGGIELRDALSNPNASTPFGITIVNGGDNSQIRVNVTALAKDNGQHHTLVTLHDVSELAELRLQLEKSIDHARYIATHDLMTGLPDRYFLLRSLNAAVERAGIFGHTLAVLFIDIDNFKQINDTLGHEVGDQLIRAVAARLRKLLPADGMMARMGGDEFALMLPMADRRATARLAAKVEELFARSWALAQRQSHLSASIGVALFPEDGTSGEELLRHADMAMYQSKTDGRNRLTWFSGEIRARGERRGKVIEALRVALDCNRLRLNLQPKFDVSAPHYLSSPRLAGAEVLLRLDDPSLGPIGPSEFVPAAELAGLMPAIDLAAARLTGDVMRRWRSLGTMVPLAVNLSTATLDSPQPDELGDQLQSAGLTPDLVSLEMTETGLAAPSDRRALVLGQLRDAGWRISIDDFGTGQSALSVLQSLPIGELKIDRSFVRALDGVDRERALAIVRAILALARALGLGTVAEGVETEAQLRMLRDEGCTVVQGFLLSPPLEVAAFEEKFLFKTQGGKTPLMLSVERMSR